MPKFQSVAVACLFLASTCVLPWCAADELPAAAQSTPEQIRQWVKELDADSFAARQAATRKLIEAGKAAIDETAKAAEGESLEVTTRALEVLTKLYQSSDAATKDAAKTELEKLKSSKNAVAARQAGKALVPPAAARGTANLPQAPGLPRAIPNVPRAVGARITTKTSVVNGVKTVEIDENGKIVKILDDPNNGITVTITEKVDGKDKTSTHTAKNADELKNKHPDAHAYYDKYVTRRNAALGAIQLRAGGNLPIQIPLPGLPVPVAPPAGKSDLHQKALQQVALAQKQLEATAVDLKKAAASGANAEELKKLAERIEATARQIADAQKQLAD